MKVNLIVNKTNFDLLKSGTKKTEWRNPSVFNKKLLFKKREQDDKMDGNKDIKFIQFFNGYKKERDSIIIECKSIRLVRFSRFVNIPEDNFQANEGDFAIEITLGNIV